VPQPVAVLGCSIAPLLHGPLPASRCPKLLICLALSPGSKASETLIPGPTCSPYILLWLPTYTPVLPLLSSKSFPLFLQLETQTHTLGLERKTAMSI